MRFTVNGQEIVLIPSFSMFEALATCPKRFVDQYLIHAEPEPSYAMQFGQQIHKAIESILKGKKLAEAVQHLQDVKLADYELAHLLLARAMKYASELPKYGRIIDITAEYKFAVKEEDGVRKPTDFDDPEAIFRGVADAVITFEDVVGQRYSWIIDWKTGNFPPASVQLMLYMHFLNQTRAIPYTVEKGIFVLLRSDNSIEIDYDEITGEMAEHFFRTGIKQLEEVMKMYESGTVDYIPGKHCIYCPFLKTCTLPEVEEYNPENMLKYALFYEAKAKRYKDMLKEYLDTSMEEVEYSGHVAYKSRSIGYKIKDPARFVEKLGNLEEQLASQTIEIKLKKPEGIEGLENYLKDGIVEQRVSERMVIRKKKK